VTAWSEVLDRAGVGVPGAGAIRLRLVAAKAGTPAGPVRAGDGSYAEGVLLDLDIWALMPR
jgi:2-methylfumaryl-CoA hydratase